MPFVTVGWLARVRRARRMRRRGGRYSLLRRRCARTSQADTIRLADPEIGRAVRRHSRVP